MILIKHFPIEIGFPERIVVDKQKYFELVNKHNGYKNCFFWVYNSDIVDKLFFDFDGENCLGEARKFVDYLKKYNYKFCVLFSGRGFHIYVFTGVYEKLKNPKAALDGAQQHMINETGCVVDEQIVGDIKRLGRIPNTLNIKSRRYCVFLTMEDLELGYEHIANKAKTQCWTEYVHGSNTIDIAVFDSRKSNSNINMPDLDYEVEIDDDLIKDFIPCVKKWLVNADNNKSGCDYQARYFFAVYCRDTGIPKSVCNKIAFKYFSKKFCNGSNMDAFKHFRKTKVLDYVYDKRDDFFPNCKTLYTMGLCDGKCDRHDSMYF